MLVWFTGHPVVAQSWDWASTAGGSSSDKGLDMDIDADGNLYVCGYYNFQANFDTITTPSAFGKEGFIAKIDPSGAWQWVRTANGGWDERVLGICVDKVNGYVYATGTTWNNINTFGSCAPAPFQGSADNIFVGKFDLDGNCIWTVLAGGGADDHGYDLITDQQGNIYLTGFISDEYFQNTTAVFGSISVSILLGDSICFVAKMSPDGTFLWVKTFDGTDGERDNRIAIDSDANVYITGGFWGTKPFGDTTVTSEGGNDIFVIKFDKDGNQQWVRTVGSTLGDRGNSITVDQFDNIYVTGEFRDTLRFGTDDLNNYGSPGGRDIFVARITPDGEWLWATKAGSNGGQEKGTYITSNDNENIFVTGQFKRTAKFGSITITSVGDTLQAFVGAISTTGVWHWVLQGGGTFADRGSGIAVDESCNVYVAGYYVLNADFAGYSLTGLGLKDVFVAKVKDGCFEFGPPHLRLLYLKIPSSYRPHLPKGNSLSRMLSPRTGTVTMTC